jgi:hypothetical protein
MLVHLEEENAEQFERKTSETYHMNKAPQPTASTEKAQSHPRILNA